MITVCTRQTGFTLQSLWISELTFWTKELTRMMVFIHFQPILSPYQSSSLYGDSFCSSGSSNTGIITTANLEISHGPCLLADVAYAECEKTGPRRYNSQSAANLIPGFTTHPSDLKWW
jgi:hypothetical protein